MNRYAALVVVVLAATLATPARPGRAADADPVSARPDLSLEALAATREHPLFSPSRQLPPPPPPEPPPHPSESSAPPPPEKPAAPPFDLTGTIVGPEARIALLRNTQTNKMVQLKQDDSAEGWTLKQVDERSAVFTDEDQENEVSLVLKAKCSGEACADGGANAHKPGADDEEEPAPPPRRARPVRPPPNPHLTRAPSLQSRSHARQTPNLTTPLHRRRPPVPNPRH